MPAAKAMPSTWKRKRAAEQKLQLAIVKAVEAYLPRLEASAERAIAVRYSTLTTRNEFQAVDQRLTRAVEVLQQQASTLREHVGALAVNVGDLMKGNAPRLPTTHEMFERIPTGDLLDELRRRVNE